MNARERSILGLLRSMDKEIQALSFLSGMSPQVRGRISNINNLLNAALENFPEGYDE